MSKQKEDLKEREAELIKQLTQSGIKLGREAFKWGAIFAAAGGAFFITYGLLSKRSKRKKRQKDMQIAQNPGQFTQLRDSNGNPVIVQLPAPTQPHSQNIFMQAAQRAGSQLLLSVGEKLLASATLKLTQIVEEKLNKAEASQPTNAIKAGYKNDKAAN